MDATWKSSDAFLTFSYFESVTLRFCKATRITHVSADLQPLETRRGGVEWLHTATLFGNDLAKVDGISLRAIGRNGVVCSRGHCDVVKQGNYETIGLFHKIPRNNV